jgi:hypothetical protein
MPERATAPMCQSEFHRDSHFRENVINITVSLSNQYSVFHIVNVSIFSLVRPRVWWEVKLSPCLTNEALRHEDVWGEWEEYIKLNHREMVSSRWFERSSRSWPTAGVKLAVLDFPILLRENKCNIATNIRLTLSYLTTLNHLQNVRNVERNRVR